MGDGRLKSVRTLKRPVFSSRGENTGGIRLICSEIAFSGSHRGQKRRATRGFAAISRL